MSRRRRSSRWFSSVLLLVALAAAAVTVYRLRGSAPAPLAHVDQRGAEVAAPVVLPPRTETPRPALATPVLATTQTPEPAPRRAGTPAAATPRVQEAAAPARPTTVPVRPSADMSGGPLVAAQRLAAAGELVEARALLSDALTSGQLGGPDLTAAQRQLAAWNQDLVFSRRLFAGDPWAAAYTVQSGDRLARVAQNYSTTWELICRINQIPDPARVRAGQSIKVPRGPFHAVIYKSRFLMEVYLGGPGGTGSIFVAGYPVGLGQDDSTPTGTWRVEPQKKLRNPTYYSPRGEGIIAADDPRNPLGEFWIGLTGVEGAAVGRLSYGIHGTIDPASIGRMDSLGCIRMHNEDVAVVFDLLVEGKSLVLVRE